MGEVHMQYPQSQITNMEKGGNVILDIESLAQSSEKCSGSPKLSKALSRKGSNRMERRNNEEQETDDTSRKVVLKVVCPQLDQLKQSLVCNKGMPTNSSASINTCLAESLDGRSKRFNRLTIHPRKILLLFASMSSMGTMILIYFTLAINRRGGA